jgi:hypothetical protein
LLAEARTWSRGRAWLSSARFGAILLSTRCDVNAIELACTAGGHPVSTLILHSPRYLMNNFCYICTCSNQSLILAPHHLNNLLHPLTPHPLKPIHSHSKRAPPARQRPQMLQIPDHLLQRHASSNSPHPTPALIPRNSSASRAMERIRRRINPINIHHRPVGIRERCQGFRVGRVEG